MGYITDKNYYDNAANHGSYQYVSLQDIVNNFMLMYTGNHSLINNEERYKIPFHAKRAIQELNYDAARELKVLQLNVTDNLTFILPPDYVNWVRISLYKDGVLRPLTQNVQTNYAKAYSQEADGDVIFNSDGSVVLIDSEINSDRLDGTKRSIYLNPRNPFHGMEGYELDGDWYFKFNMGARFGLNTETANMNPTFRIDKKTGVINFSSEMLGESCILEYISDGMENGDNSSIGVNKLFEQYVYAYIEAEMLNSKLGVQEYIVHRARKRKTALLRNAKIRISDMHPSKIMQVMRNKDKWLK